MIGALFPMPSLWDLTFRTLKPPMDNRRNKPNPSPPCPPFPPAEFGVCIVAPALTTLPRGCIIRNGSLVGGDVASGLVTALAPVEAGAADVLAFGTTAAADGGGGAAANEIELRRRWCVGDRSSSGAVRGPAVEGELTAKPGAGRLIGPAGLPAMGGDPPAGPPDAGQPHRAPPAKRPPPAVALLRGEEETPVTVAESSGDGISMPSATGEREASSAPGSAWPFSRAISGPSQTPPRVDEGFLTLREPLPPPGPARERGLAEGGDAGGGVGRDEPADVPASDEEEGDVESAGSEV